MQVKSLDNIDNAVLDLLASAYSNLDNYRLLDERVSNDGYFLLEFNDNTQPSFKFIWISSNLWQYDYCNTHCKTHEGWMDPVRILNNLITIAKIKEK